ncbi:hypothetical protein SKAU_G00367120 [Synaphobranchus kaupii]|uniref:Uncharacterized protein n=1 Tax=Synaphobranchus kaupii TaxID=118154 RepID=A0A9Q1EFD2_SYNKA|nr:hypothetical protein SKAU_G00367120 [Synaphobranchus kaupii]
MQCPSAGRWCQLHLVVSHGIAALVLWKLPSYLTECKWVNYSATGHWDSSTFCVMASVSVGRTAKQMTPPRPVWVKDGRTSNTQLLERMVNYTTLSTQRVLHTHILELGERLCPSSSPSSPPGTGPSPGPVQSPHSPSSKQLVGAAAGGDKPWTQVFTQLAEEEKERALKKQSESLQASFAQALSSRDRLEAELRQGQRVELLARFEQERAGLRAQTERETRLAVEEACERLRTQLLREAEETRRRETETFQAEAQERLKQRVQEVEKRVRAECEAVAQRDRETLQDGHTDELSQLQGRIQQLEGRLRSVTREKMQYESEFKKVQCSYRQFVDLTESSLHSDYLLKLRRLGREPGLTETEVQTDDIVIVRPTPWPLSRGKVH